MDTDCAVLNTKYEGNIQENLQPVVEAKNTEATARNIPDTLYVRLEAESPPHHHLHCHWDRARALFPPETGNAGASLVRAMWDEDDIAFEEVRFLTLICCIVVAGLRDQWHVFRC